MRRNQFGSPQTTSQPYAVGLAYLGAAALRLVKGDWAQARPLYEQGAAAYRTSNTVLVLPTLLASWAWALAQLGEADEARILLGEAEQLLEGNAVRGANMQRAPAYRLMGRTCLLLGRLDEAWSLGQRAVDSSAHQRGFAAYAWHLLGDIVIQAGRFDAERGGAHYRHALALAEPRGMRPLIAQCHLSLGKLYGCTDKPEEAREHLTTAATMYREMGMMYWLEKAESEMRQLG